MFHEVLIESAGKDKKKGGWITAAISTVVHIAVVGVLIAAGKYVDENPQVLDQPMTAFVVASAPPPPPPPPPAASAGATPRRRVETPVEQRPQEFRQPTQVPQNVRDVSDVSTETNARGATEGGVVGGVEGGVAGGVVGGQIGGVIGGDLDGQLGGRIGGQGDVPVRVGGNVKAPVAVVRIDPVYTEVARRARVQGIVIIEAVIDRNGNVTDARVLKPLPMGLDQAALDAVRRWKFRPGTLNGQPVPVYYNLTVNFRIE